MKENQRWGKGELKCFYESIQCAPLLQASYAERQFIRMSPSAA